MASSSALHNAAFPSAMTERPSSRLESTKSIVTRVEPLKYTRLIVTMVCPLQCARLLTVPSGVESELRGDFRGERHVEVVH
jgi:hypothetical protein